MVRVPANEASSYRFLLLIAQPSKSSYSRRSRGNHRSGAEPVPVCAALALGAHPFLVARGPRPPGSEGTARQLERSVRFPYLLGNCS